MDGLRARRSAPAPQQLSLAYSVRDLEFGVDFVIVSHRQSPSAVLESSTAPSRESGSLMWSRHFGAFRKRARGPYRGETRGSSGSEREPRSGSLFSDETLWRRRRRDCAKISMRIFVYLCLSRASQRAQIKLQIWDTAGRGVSTRGSRFSHFSIWCLRVGVDWCLLAL